MNNQKCNKCNHEWFARVEKPKQCPKCKNYIKEEVRQLIEKDMKKIKSK